MKRPIVLLDVDGVICDFNRFYIRCAKRARVLPTDFDDSWQPKAWSVGDSLNLTEEGRMAVHRVLSTHGAVHLGIEPYEGALDGVRKLMLIANVFFPTTSFEENSTWETDRRAWFRDHLGDEAAKRLIFTEHKHVVFGDVFVDDKTSNLQEWKKRWPGLGVLWPHPHNEDPPEGIRRPDAKDWGWLIDQVSSL